MVAVEIGFCHLWRVPQVRRGRVPHESAWKVPTSSCTGEARFMRTEHAP